VSEVIYNRIAMLRAERGISRRKLETLARAARYGGGPLLRADHEPRSPVE
jgi:hypothetical protein